MTTISATGSANRDIRSTTGIRDRIGPSRTLGWEGDWRAAGARSLPPQPSLNDEVRPAALPRLDALLRCSAPEPRACPAGRVRDPVHRRRRDFRRLGGFGSTTTTP